MRGPYMPREKARPPLAQHILRVRHACELNQSAFAALLGVNQPYVSNLEDGTVIPETGILMRIGSLAQGEARAYFAARVRERFSAGQVSWQQLLDLIQEAACV
jgi:transcriptional regulator with XRE-family HTH domain